MRKFEENYTTTDGENHETFEDAKEHQGKLDHAEVLKIIQPLREFLQADEENNIQDDDLNDTLEEIANEIMSYV